MLPEPPGVRHGRTGQGRSGHGVRLRLLITGDSAAAGVGASSQLEALSGRLSGLLAERFDVHWQLNAQTGLSASELLERLELTAPAAVDVAVVSIGVNDVTGRTSLTRWRSDIRQLADCLRSRHGARTVLFSSLPPMHRFPALPQPLRWYLGARARDFDCALARVLEPLDGRELLRLEWPYEPRYMATDGFHPSAAAYLEWARMLAGRIPLTEDS